MFVTYLTVYYGDKLPRRYIGYSSEEKVKSGYHGTVLSKKFKELWECELRENPHLFKTRILTRHTTREEGLEMEKEIQLRHNVVKNPNYINQSLSTPNGMFGRDVSGENHPMWGKTHTTESRKLISDNHHDVTGKNNPRYGNSCYILIDPEGKEIPVMGGITILCNKLRVRYPHIVSVCKGLRNHTGGWKGRYMTEEEKQIYRDNEDCYF